MTGGDANAKSKGGKGDPAGFVAQSSSVTAKEKQAEIDSSDKPEQPVQDNERQIPYTLSFENLTVYVPGSKRNCCNCLDNPFGKFLQEYLGISIEERDPFYALDDVSGVLKSGELCLVLGSNDQSKSTLLRTLSGRSNEQDEMSGSILLNGIPLPKSHQGWRRLCPYVSASDTSHSAVLTVRETFEFAAKCTSDGHQTNEQINAKVERLMGNLGLAHVADTVVGDENLRGVSGGQKRRVTVGEMMLDSSCRFLCMENITDGLSSSDSTQLIQLCSNACHDMGYSGFVSLLQPSDEMIQLFDKVLVLTSEGELAYFGPVHRPTLQEIFLESKDPADDKGSICDLVLSQSYGDSVHEREEALVGRYANSDVAKSVGADIALNRSSAPPARKRNIGTLLPEKPFPNSAAYQFKIISERRIKLINRNAVTWTRVLIAIVFGIIIGSLFSALSNNLIGALGRTGYIFLNCFLVLMLSAAVTIPSAYRERVTLFKHRSAEFYDGGVAYIAQLLTDAPLSIMEAVLLSCISYFWVGLSDKLGDFFYFMGTLVALECAGQALGRLLCALYRKQVTANAMSSVVILIFGTVGGFMPSFGAIHPILRWLSWVTPVSYAFEGLMINEFYQLKMDPLVAANQSGPAPLALSGNTWLGNYGLPRIEGADEENIRIFNIFMIFVFAIVYDILGFYYIEKTRSWYHNQTRRPQSIVKSSFTMEAPIAVPAKKEAKLASIDEETDPASSWPQSLTVRNLCYEVPLGSKRKRMGPGSLIRYVTTTLAGKKKAELENDTTLQSGKNLRLLNDVHAQFCRGRMTALMGTSGAGKTTLLDVIAGYKTGGTISGDIMIDGRQKDPSVWKTISGYAEQNDILNPYLSVIETLRFTANCRLASSVDKTEVINRILKLMNLERWKNYVVGREAEGEGLPKHARKRLTIAIQLIIQPKILFLDEPTTGLGNNAAALVISAVRAATDALGLITVATIHQPSKFIWDSFDDVLLLVRGGRVTYMGESGPNSETVLGYFSSLAGDSSSSNSNPADYCLDVLNKLEPAEAETAFANSERCDLLKNNIEDSIKNPAETPDVGKHSANNVFREFLLLTVRHMIVQWRNPSYCFMRLISSVAMSLYIGVLFIGDKSDINGAVFSIGAIFFLVFVLVIPMQAAVIPLVEDRAVLYRETVSGTYSRISYGLGQLVADQPFHLLNTLFMFVFFYFLVDFRLTGEEMGYFAIMLYLANWVIQSLGQLFALATPNEESANGLGGLSVILSVILMGFLITVSAMPDGWVWAYWSNLFRYMLQGFVTNELAGNSYSIDVAAVLPGVIGSANLGLMAFGNSTIDPTSRQAHQLSSIINLAVIAPEGVNEEGRNLPQLIDCTIQNECFTDPTADIGLAFTSCYLLPRSPCSDELTAVIENIDFEEISKCFGDSGNSTEVVDDSSMYLPAGVKAEDLEEMDDDARREIVLCLLKAILPGDKLDAIQRLIEIIKRLVGVIMFFMEIIENGIQLPGEWILFFFGWAVFEEGEGIIAPFKWWYCMSSVGIFLGAIELLKLFSIRFIVWTKR